jgi:hypothetical protein
MEVFSCPKLNRFIINLFTDGGYTQWTEFSPCTAKCADERGDRVRFVNLTFERKHFQVFTLLMRFNYYIRFDGTWNNCLSQGFSTIWYPRTPKSKLYPSAYPQIRNICPLRTPQIKNSTQNGHLLSVFYLFCVPPVTFSCTPRGTRSPG